MLIHGVELTVHPDHRGNQLCERLLATLLDLRPKDARRFWSYAAANNGASLTTFLRSGFKVCGYMADPAADGGGWVYVERRLRPRRAP